MDKPPPYSSVSGSDYESKLYEIRVPQEPLRTRPPFSNDLQSTGESSSSRTTLLLTQPVKMTMLMEGRKKLRLIGFGDLEAISVRKNIRKHGWSVKWEREESKICTIKLQDLGWQDDLHVSQFVLSILESMLQLGWQLTRSVSVGGSEAFIFEKRPNRAIKRAVGMIPYEFDRLVMFGGGVNKSLAAVMTRAVPRYWPKGIQEVKNPANEGIIDLKLRGYPWMDGNSDLVVGAHLLGNLVGLMLANGLECYGQLRTSSKHTALFFIEHIPVEE